MAHAEQDQGAQVIVLQTDPEVHAVRPHVHVILVVQVSLTEGPVLLLPRRGHPRDAGCRQARGLLSQQRAERLLEVARRQIPQVQDRQDLLDLRRATHVRRQDRAREAMVRPPVVDPGSPDLHRAGAHRHLPRAGPAVAHHQCPAVLPALECGASPFWGEGGVETAHGPGLVFEAGDGRAGLEALLDFGQGPELLERAHHISVAVAFPGLAPSVGDFGGNRQGRWKLRKGESVSRAKALTSRAKSLGVCP